MHTDTHTHTYTHTHTDTYPNANAHTYAHADSFANGYRHAGAIADGDDYGNAQHQSECCAQPHRNRHGNAEPHAWRHNLPDSVDDADGDPHQHPDPISDRVHHATRGRAPALDPTGLAAKQRARTGGAGSATGGGIGNSSGRTWYPALATALAEMGC